MTDAISLAHEVERIIQIKAKYRGRIVPVDVWWPMVDNLLDSSDGGFISWHEMFVELSKMYLAGEGGTLYLEHWSAEESEKFKTEITTAWNNPKDGWGEDLQREYMTLEDCLNNLMHDFMHPTDMSNPKFCEVYCEEAPMTYAERQAIMRAHTDPHILEQRRINDTPAMRRYARRY